MPLNVHPQKVLPSLMCAVLNKGYLSTVTDNDVDLSFRCIDYIPHFKFDLTSKCSGTFYNASIFCLVHNYKCHHMTSSSMVTRPTYYIGEVNCLFWFSKQNVSNCIQLEAGKVAMVNDVHVEFHILL